MQITYTKVTPQVINRNRNFYKNHARKAFVMWCAYEGLLDKVLTPEEIVKAKKEGKLPKDLNVHHKIPLSGSMDLFVNDFSNLSIIHRNTHRFITQNIYAPKAKRLNDKPYGSEIQIDDVINYPYVDVDGIFEERRIQNLINRRKLNGRD